MSRKTRVLIAVVVVEAGLAGLWWYLARFGLTHPDRVAPGFQRVLGQTLGAAIGGFLGLSLLLFLMAARNDRKAMQKR
jgi:hypothetical protein